MGCFQYSDEEGTAAYDFEDKVPPKVIERRWREEFGAEVVDGLRGALEELAVGDGDGRPRLFAGLQPYPDGWRASVRRPRTLPHYPMVLHRGGYPDGS